MHFDPIAVLRLDEHHRWNEWWPQLGRIATDGCPTDQGGMLDLMDQERYELVDVIGSGGMATVWRARDTRLGRMVAIKRPHPAPADSWVLQRFRREARAAATINHRNLVSVYDVGEDDSGPYLVMEYVDGPSLAAATVPTHDLAQIGIQLASALAALHGAGVVHGDVKPANILVADDGVKLTDFGIARTGDDTTPLTREGTVYATPEYAAPEILKGEPRTPAADIYALGAVLHELVTGSRWNPQVASTQTMPPPAWLPVLAAALDHDPARRPSAAGIGQQLARLEHTRELPAAMMPPTERLPTSVVPSQQPKSSPAPARPTIHGRGSGKTAVVIFAGSMIALAAVAGAFALSEDDGDLDSMLPITGPPAEETASAVVSEPSAPATTVPPTTAAPTTLPPTTPPTTTVSATAPQATTPARAIAGDLVALLSEEVRQGMDRHDAVRIVERVDEAIRAAESGKSEPVEGGLRDALRDIERYVDGDTRDDAAAMIIDLAVELGVDPDRIVDDNRGGRGDQDDNDDD